MALTSMQLPPISAAAMTHPSVALVFDPQRDAGLDTAYGADARARMETAAARAAREALRVDPSVQDAVYRFSFLYDRDADGLVNAETYRAVHARVMALLLPSFAEDERRESGLRDWVKVTHGHPRLDYSALAAATFELADRWTVGVEADEMVTFLEVLRFRLR